MNKIQKIILAIFIPVIIFFIALMIANSVGVTRGSSLVHLEGYPNREFSLPSYTHNPFDLEKTWYVWLLSLTFCCFFEYKLFADKKKKNKELEEGKEMKAFERIFLYTVLAILVFYVFLVDGTVESQVAIQEEIRARSIVIVNNAGQEVVRLWANKNGGLVSVRNKDGTPTAIMASNKEGAEIAVFNRYGTLGVEIIATEDDGGMVGVSKADAPGAIMGIYKDDGLIEVYNKHGDVIGRLP